jgi:hypothetical protein
MIGSLAGNPAVNEEQLLATLLDLIFRGQPQLNSRVPVSIMQA